MVDIAIRQQIQVVSPVFESFSHEPEGETDIDTGSMQMNVGEAAQRSGLPSKTIRYYEEIGLISPGRAGNGYRDYGDDDIHRLAFLRRARGLGFSIDDCRQLMALYRDRSRASHDVKEIALSHVSAIEGKIAELQSMRATLHKLVHACHGDDRPDCPILEDMAGGNRSRST